MPHDPRLRRALEDLSALVRERLARHPLAHLEATSDAGRDRRLDVRLTIPLAPTGADETSLEEGQRALDHEIDSLLSHRAIVRPGRVYCLRCTSSECEHSLPASSRQIFAGYGPSGLPQFVDFAQWLLERKHPELDRLYTKPPRQVVEVVTEDELTDELLPEFADRRNDFRIHGQVVAGWFEFPSKNASPAPLALCLQVVSSAERHRPRRGKGRKKGGPPRRRLGLGVLTQGPEGESLEDLYARLEGNPWASVVGWTQRVLETIEQSAQGKKGDPDHLNRRIHGALRSVARRLEQGERSRTRRTGHAQKRHHEGDRPTRMAQRDLARARPESVLFDTRRETLIVLGDRGRAHVWNGQGKLVTSIRYSTDSIERKKHQQIWRPASSEEVALLRKTVGAGEEPEDPPLPGGSKHSGRGTGQGSSTSRDV